MRCSLVQPAAILLVLVSHATAVSAPPALARGTLLPVFTIAKSENKNQVQYVVRVDDRCAPLGPAPLSAYWRMLERGPTATAPLLSREVPAYGLANQAVVANDAIGGRVAAVLKVLPDRPVTIDTRRGGDGACRAMATVTLAGTQAHLFNVYVHLRWDGVDYLLLQGWSMDGSQVVREKIAK